MPKKRTQTHYCDLKMGSDSYLPKLPPQAGKVRRFFRRLRKIFVVSAASPECQETLRSHAAITNERIRSYQLARHIIHPFSKLSMYIEIVTAITWIMVFIKDPFAIAFLPPNHKIDSLAYNVFLLTTDLILMMYSITCFCRGYHVFETKEIVLDPKRIAIHYMRTFFIFDFIGTIPFNNILMYILGIYPRTALYILSLSRLARFARLRTMLKYLKQLTTLLNMKEITHDIIRLVLVTIYMVHWWACIVYMIPKIRYKLTYDLPSTSWIMQAKIAPSNSPVYRQYLNSLMMASCHFYLAGSGNYKVLDPTEEILFTLVFITGITYFAYITAVVFEMLGSLSVSETKFEEILTQLHEYMSSKKLPVNLRHRMIMYYRNKFQMHYFREHSILLTLSEHLRDEMTSFCTKRLLDQVTLLQGMSRALTGQLTARLKQEVYLPNDIIYTLGAPAEAMYFVVHGTVAVTAANGREVYHYKDGDLFGEVALVLKYAHLVRQSTTVAIEITECLRLEKMDLWDLMSTSEEFSRRMNQYAREKYQKIVAYNTVVKYEEEEATGMKHGLLHDLRRGKIVAQRQPRPLLIKK